MRKCVSLCMIMAIVLLPLMVNTATAVGCFAALRDVIPCQGYLIGGASKPSDECCKGVKDLANIANESKSERQSLCKCLKQAAQNFPINEENAKALPNLCHVKLNIAISPDVDCNKV